MSLNGKAKSTIKLRGIISFGGGSHGEDGATFYPYISSEGELSWSNNKGLENPPPVDLVDLVLAALPVWNGGSY